MSSGSIYIFAVTCLHAQTHILAFLSIPTPRLFPLQPGWHYRLVGEYESMFMQRRRSTASRIALLLRRKWRQVRHTSALENQFQKWESMDGDDRCYMQISRYQGGNQHA